MHVSAYNPVLSGPDSIALVTSSRQLVKRQATRIFKTEEGGQLGASQAVCIVVELQVTAKSVPGSAAGVTECARQVLKARLAAGEGLS